MDQRRQGEIAIKLVKYMLRQRGITLNPVATREFGNAAKEMNIPLDELMDFVRPIAQEIFDDCF